SLLVLVVLLAGCRDINSPIDAESTGIWNQYFVYPMSQFIQFFADLLSSYALAIIVVTIIIRTILLPLNIKQLKSSKTMKDIQPQIKELQKKYRSKDANTQQKLQQETMALIQNNDVNTLNDCLPIFV